MNAIKRLIRRAAVWAGLHRSGQADRYARDVQLDRYIASSLTDEALAWALGTWSKRYL